MMSYLQDTQDIAFVGFIFLPSKRSIYFVGRLSFRLAFALFFLANTILHLQLVKAKKFDKWKGKRSETYVDNKLDVLVSSKQWLVPFGDCTQ